MSGLLRDVFGCLRERPGRTLLALAALGFGALMMVLLLGVMAGLDRRARGLVSELGRDTIGIHGVAAGALTLGHAERIRAAWPDLDVSAARFLRVALEEGGECQAMATDESMLATRGWPVVEGRAFDRRDLEERAPVALLSAPLAARLALRAGDRIRMERRAFDIVGIVRTGDEAAGESELVMVPLGAGDSLAASRTSPGQAVDAIYVRAGRNGDTQALQARLRHLLADLDPSPGLVWITADLLVERLRKVRESLLWSAGSAVAAGLLLGGLCLAVLMMASVRERVQEIGLRRALGAAPARIRSLFLAEGLVLAFSGAAIGMAAGRIVLSILKARTDLPVEWRVDLSIGMCAVMLLVGLAGALGPASRAADMNPSDALRSE